MRDAWPVPIPRKSLPGLEDVGSSMQPDFPRPCIGARSLAAATFTATPFMVSEEVVRGMNTIRAESLRSGPRGEEPRWGRAGILKKRALPGSDER